VLLPWRRRSTEPGLNNLAIETRGLRKVFGGRVAVRSLSLEVREGEVFGLLGPNGAGKSTSVKMLLGLVAPTSGEGRLLGAPLGDVKIRRRIGFLPEHFRFYEWLTGSELLHLHGRLQGMSRAELRQRVPEMIEMVGLTPHAGKQVRHYSKGMIQRVGLAQALINRPDLIFLDEPTSGLDPAGRKLVYEIIRREKQRGAAILLNSHLLSEVERSSDRVAFIRDGEVLQTRELQALLGGETVVKVRAREIPPSVVPGLDAWATHVHVEPAVSGGSAGLSFRVASSEALPQVLRHLVTSGVDVFEFTPQRQSLEDLFLEIVGSGGSE
jgi:ABC-2 type transport system ATP-binding protein